MTDHDSCSDSLLTKTGKSPGSAGGGRSALTFERVYQGNLISRLCANSGCRLCATTNVIQNVAAAVAAYSPTATPTAALNCSHRSGGQVFLFASYKWLSGGNTPRGKRKDLTPTVVPTVVLTSTVVPSFPGAVSR